MIKTGIEKKKKKMCSLLKEMMPAGLWVNMEDS